MEATENVEICLLDSPPTFDDYVEDDCLRSEYRKSDLWKTPRWATGCSWKPSRARVCAKARVQSTSCESHIRICARARMQTANCDSWSSSLVPVCWSLLGSKKRPSRFRKLQIGLKAQFRSWDIRRATTRGQSKENLKDSSSTTTK